MTARPGGLYLAGLEAALSDTSDRTTERVAASSSIKSFPSHLHLLLALVRILSSSIFQTSILPFAFAFIVLWLATLFRQFNYNQALSSPSSSINILVLAKMQSFTHLLVLLSLFQVSVLSSPMTIADTVSHAIQLVTRQTTTNITCFDYSQTANYSNIAKNSTLRAAFIQSSPQGTDATTAVIDTAATRFLKDNMTFDAVLNAQCGNLTTVSITEAGVNLTNGIVGGFKIKKTANAGVRIGSALGTVTLVTLIVGAGLL